MTYKLTATISHKSFDAPVVKEMYYSGDTLDSILDQLKELNVPPNHLFNLKKHKRTAFKDDRGVKHAWKLILMEYTH